MANGCAVVSLAGHSLGHLCFLSQACSKLQYGDYQWTGVYVDDQTPKLGTAYNSGHFTSSLKGAGGPDFTISGVMYSLASCFISSPRTETRAEPIRGAKLVEIPLNGQLDALLMDCAKIGIDPVSAETQL